VSAPWYQDGLCFACTRCGNCCTGEPGSVRVDEGEAATLARYIGLDLADFHERHARVLPDGAISLREKPNGECVFWSRALGCTVYAVRPRQCRTWPFWRANLASLAHWRTAARGCPGIDQGPLHPADLLVELAANDGTSGFVPAPDVRDAGLED
jgi:hypothetical protein